MRRVPCAWLLLAPIVAALSGCGGDVSSPPARPRSASAPRNLLLLTLDTTRADRLGCYGHEAAETPHLDALAARGTRFENAIVPVALTRPAHATLLTGVLPHRHGVWSNGPYRLDTRWPTLAERFGSAGFRTAAVVASFVLGSSFGLERGFEAYDDTTREIEGGDPEKPAADVARVAASFLGGNVTPPFFLWLHFYDPHDPYDPPEPFRSRFAANPYDGEIAAMDSAIGDALEALAQKGWLSETLVVAVADHGEGLGEHGEPTHGYFLYDSTLRVPLLLAGPGVPTGLRVDAQVTLADLAPTLLDAFDLLQEENRLDGRSFWRELQSGGVAPRTAVLENRAIRNQYGWAALSGVRADGLKWIEAAPPELYDLSADPEEAHNVASAEHTADRSATLRALWRRERPPNSAAGAPGHLSPEQEARLAALGYVAAPSVGERTLGGGVDAKSMAAVIPDIERLIQARRTHRMDEIPALVARVLAHDPGNLFALRVQGEHLVRERRYEEAVHVLGRLVEHGEAHPETYAHLAEAHQRVGRLPEAVRWYERATAPPWVYWPALESLARIAKLHPRELSREALLQKLRALKAHSAREGLSLARAFAILDEHARAETWFAHSVGLDPNLTPARVGLAQMLSRRGRHVEALAGLRQIHPPTAESLYTAGAVRSLQGHKAEACRAFARALALEPMNANLCFGLGRSLAACGEPTLARDAFERALRTEPGFIEARRALEGLDARRGHRPPIRAPDPPEHPVRLRRTSATMGCA